MTLAMVKTLHPVGAKNLLRLVTPEKLLVGRKFIIYTILSHGTYRGKNKKKFDRI